jgi:hypothetical protein
MACLCHVTDKREKLMWRSFMRSWLIGAAIAIASPENGLRAEPTDSSGDPWMNCGDGSDRHLVPQSAEHDKAWIQGEPTLDEMLADPIVI